MLFRFRTYETIFTSESIKEGCLPAAGVPPDQRPSTNRVQTQDCRHLWDQTGPKNAIHVDENENENLFRVARPQDTRSERGRFVRRSPIGFARFAITIIQMLDGRSYLSREQNAIGSFAFYPE